MQARQSSTLARRGRTLILALATLGMAAIAQAQDFPTKPLRFIVPTTPGSTGDLVGRVMEHLERFGRKMAKAREWFGLDDERHEKRGEGRRGHNPKLRTLRHRLKSALVDIMEGPAEKQDEAIAILEGSIEALEALARR